MKQTIISFIKDEISSILIYLLSTAVIILFYSIELGHQVEFYYPLMLSLFIGAVFEGIRCYRYIRRNKRVNKMMAGTLLKETSMSEFEKYLDKESKQLHQNYLQMLDELSAKYRYNQRFASSLIHNMKTPVAVSNLILQRVNHGEMEGSRAISLLQEENEKLSTTLDNILELQRIEEAAKDYQPRLLSLEQEVKDLINSNRSLFIQNHVYPKLICNEETYNVLSDSKWNRVMLQQLISNAVKYSHVVDAFQAENASLMGAASESKYVTFEITKQTVNGNLLVELKIKDQGIGIPTYDLPRVFEPFYTGDNGRKCYNSSGIGLYLCKEIAKLLGTKLTIQSKVGEGTTVSISYLTKL
jgi:signal transduction histidine kinase